MGGCRGGGGGGLFSACAADDEAVRLRCPFGARGCAHDSNVSSSPTRSFLRHELGLVETLLGTGCLLSHGPPNPPTSWSIWSAVIRAAMPPRGVVSTESEDDCEITDAVRRGGIGGTLRRGGRGGPALAICLAGEGTVLLSLRKQIVDRARQ
jgi:hypothetical protein